MSAAFDFNTYTFQKIDTAINPIDYDGILNGPPALFLSGTFYFKNIPVVQGNNTLMQIIICEEQDITYTRLNEDGDWTPWASSSSLQDTQNLIITLNSGQSVGLSTTANPLQIINNTVFNIIKNGNLITPGTNASGDYYVLAPGYRWQLTITAQANFANAGDEMQVYYSLAPDGTTYTNAPVNLRTVSNGVAASVNGSAHTRVYEIDSSNAEIFIRIITISSASGATITSNNQFELSIDLI